MTPSRREIEDGARDERGTIDLVEAIVDDTRGLVAAHVDALRDDVGHRLSALGATLGATVFAFSITIVTALLLGIAIALSLVAVGLPSWAAFWIVTLAAAALGAGLVQRARRKAGAAGNITNHAAERLKDDVAWIAHNATDHEGH